MVGDGTSVPMFSLTSNNVDGALASASDWQGKRRFASEGVGFTKLHLKSVFSLFFLSLSVFGAGHANGSRDLFSMICSICPCRHVRQMTNRRNSEVTWCVVQCS